MEMDFEKHKQEIFQLSESLDIKLNNVEGIDCFLPFFRKIEGDSSVLIIKLDGEREENTYTLLVSGKLLGQGEYIRAETSDLEGGLSFIIVEYAKKVWNWFP
ncbi:hypothetical protein NQ117_16780 [Paenibacillus sp. SC116]|uniref:hypothetical protein n=1 Tax=Paenibacillus sp. SC116 TaxID=2968986 RepID=UPI00215A62F2|nr:hypothetical protein [Paenibacillus sp. SC116]MCR8845340.1 hypothetical protein [Paenibacillus sp. SC116]